MAFENVTFFEIHLGDTTIDTADLLGDESATTGDTVQTPDVESTDAGGSGLGRVLALVLLSVVLAVSATFLARKFFGEESVEE